MRSQLFNRKSMLSLHRRRRRRRRRRCRRRRRRRRRRRCLKLATKIYCHFFSLGLLEFNFYFCPTKEFQKMTKIPFF